jgi:hypothetical protein
MASLNQPGHYGQRRARRGRLGGRGTNPVPFCMNLVVAGQLGSWARAGRRVGPCRSGGSCSRLTQAMRLDRRLACRSEARRRPVPSRTGNARVTCRGGV